jgi:hypothetical protein
LTVSKLKTKVLNLIPLAGIHWQFRAGFKKKKRFCDVYSQGGDHPETNLANSGYMPDMKVEKNQDPSIFLATYWNSL